MGNKRGILYKGSYIPVNIYLGKKKIAGWILSEKTGNSLEFTDTYDDRILGAEVNGNTVLADGVICDASGSLTIRNHDGSVSQSVTIPPLKAVNSVKDTFNILTGRLERKISGLFAYRARWSNGSRIVKDHQRVYLQDMPDFPTFTGDVAAVFDYQSYRLPYMSSQSPVYGY